MRRLLVGFALAVLLGGTMAVAQSSLAQTNPPTSQKMFLPNNFRLTIDGRPPKTDAMGTKQSTQQDAVGSARDYKTEPMKIKSTPIKSKISIKSNSPVQPTIPSD